MIASLKGWQKKEEESAQKKSWQTVDENWVHSHSLQHHPFVIDWHDY